MTEDYQGNSKKAKEPKAPVAKKIEKVVVGEVLIQKKSLGEKIKDILIKADFRSVLRHVGYNVLIPAAKNVFVDAVTQGASRVAYRDGARRLGPIHGPGPRVTYNSPINRGYRDPRDHRVAPPVEIGPRSAARHNRGDFILTSKEEAELVLERMNDIIDSYEVVTVGDLNELVGFPSSHVDNKWGWIYLADTPIRQVSSGYLIDFPPAEPLP